MYTLNAWLRVYCLANPETSAGQMYYGSSAVLPGVGYKLDNLTAWYSVATKGEDCLMNVLPSANWSLATYDAVTKICAYVWDHEVRSEWVVRDYFSSVYLPAIGKLI